MFEDIIQKEIPSSFFGNEHIICCSTCYNRHFKTCPVKNECLSSDGKVKQFEDYTRFTVKFNYSRWIRNNISI